MFKKKTSRMHSEIHIVIVRTLSENIQFIVEHKFAQDLGIYKLYLEYILHSLCSLQTYNILGMYCIPMCVHVLANFVK